MKRSTGAVFLGIFAILAPLCAGAEELPFFKANMQYPNAMIIFDNSDSMQDVPYQNPGGVSVRADPEDANCENGPGGRQWDKCTRWERDVMDAEGNPFRDGQGRLQWKEREDRPGEGKKARGGNHPSSKLYQAKQALNAILENISEVNLGFATYLTERRPNVVAKYYYEVEIENTGGVGTRWEFLAWKLSTDDKDVLSDSSDHFVWSGETFGPLDSGDTFTKVITNWGVNPHSCLPDQPVTYTVRSIREQYGKDHQFEGYLWDLRGEYTQYDYEIIEDRGYSEGCPADDTWHTDYEPFGDCDPNQLPTKNGKWTRVTTATGNGCYLWKKIPPESGGSGSDSYYTIDWWTTPGDWHKGEGHPGHIDRETYEVIPSSHVERYGETWTLVPQEGLRSVRVDSAEGPTEDVEPGRYPGDAFVYPGESNQNRPHAWSYVHKNPGGNWQATQQPDPYFPADVGNEDGNIAGDDHIIFVNLPDADTNDTTMSHRDQILEFISLERYEDYPRDPSRVFTTMPFTRSVPPSTETAEEGKATPLAASLRNAKTYYESYIRQDSQTQNQCRFNYVILLTDGLDTCDCDPLEGYENCTAPVDAARELLNLTINEMTYPVKTFVVGFGLEEDQKTLLDRIARAGGTDAPGAHYAYFATNVNDLVESLENIFAEISAGSYSRSDLAVSQDGDRIYSAYFDLPGWAGHLKAFYLDSNGLLGNPVREWGGSASENAGDAGGSIKEQTGRTVYTTAQSGVLPDPVKIRYSAQSETITFLRGHLSDIKPLLLDPTDDIDGDDAPYEDEDARLVLHFTLNPDYADGAYRGTREPPAGQSGWKLPDLYHSSPVVVGPPHFNFPWDSNYPAFKQAHSMRPTIIYIGGNGGMLHAINNADGTERWAFIPSMSLPKLKGLRVEHQFFVDGRPAVADISSDGGAGTVFELASDPEDKWHTVLISGLREGGSGYFALDVTEPSDPELLWEFTDEHLGESWSVPAIGRVRVEIGGQSQYKWIAFFGGGYSPDPDVGNRLYLLDIEKGLLLDDQNGHTGKYSIGSSTDNVPSAVQAVDMDRNGMLEAVYFGDTEGAVWKMDLTSPDMSQWQPCKIFDPASPHWRAEIHPEITPRPIYHQPAVTRGDAGNLLVLFGTGDERAPNESETQDYFYEVEDDGAAGCGGTINWVKLLDPGEKVLSRPAVFNYRVYFTTYDPSEEACGTGDGWIYGLSISRGINREGGGEAGIEFGLDGAPIEEPVERLAVGPGVPTAPVVTNGNVYTSASNQHGGPSDIFRMRIRSLAGQVRAWRETF